MRKQQGTTLIMVLVVLTILFISSLSLLRSTETATMLAGNIAFKDSAAAMADVGIRLAIADLDNIADFETTQANRYYALMQAQDNNGIATTVNWNAVAVTQMQNYNIQFVNERLCTGNLPVVDFNAQCSQWPTTIGGSNKLGANVYTQNEMYYKSTVRVTGPRNTNAIVQAILRK